MQVYIILYIILLLYVPESIASALIIELNPRRYIVIYLPDIYIREPQYAERPNVLILIRLDRRRPVIPRDSRSAAPYLTARDTRIIIFFGL